MNSMDLFKKLNDLNKSYYTFNDLKKIINFDKQTLKVKLNRMVKRGILKRIMKGIYVLYNRSINYEYFANNYLSPSYISFETALSKYGLISEVPYEITLATLNKTKRIKMNGNIIYYRKIQRKLFFGYEKIDKIYIAIKEKAYLDCIYLKIFGKPIGVKLENLNIKKLDKKLIFEYAKKYPAKIKNYIKHIFS